MTSSNFNDPKPEQRWYTHTQLAQDAWAAATNFVKKNDHVIFNGCSPLDSPTGLNERRIVLFRMTAKEFSDVLGCRFKKQVDDYDNTDEGRLQQKRGRENLKLRMKNALGECKKRLSAVTYTRIVPISGVEHTFQYDSLSDTIHKAAVQYYDAHRHIEAFADVTKEQGLVNLLILPNDQFNNAFDGRFDINAVGFVESKDCVKEYFTKLMEQASTATAAPAPTAPPADDAVASCLNAEREERIAGQVQHKALIDQNTIVIGKAHERIDNHDERIGNHDEKIDILERKIEALTPKPKKKRDPTPTPTPIPTPTPKKKRAHAHAQDQAPGSVRRSARKKPTRK